MSHCANTAFNRSDILRFYVSEGAYLTTLDGTMYEVRPSEGDAGQCDVEKKDYDDQDCEGYDAFGANGLIDATTNYWTQLQVRRHEETCMFWPIFIPSVSGNFVAISQLLTSATQFFNLPGPTERAKSVAFNGSWTFYVLDSGQVQLTTDVYLKPIVISDHTAWPKNGDKPIRVRQVAFASEVFLFLADDNMTVFKLTDPQWNGTRARDIDIEDIYDLSKLDVTFDLEQVGGTIRRFNGTKTEVLGGESKDSSQKSGEITDSGESGTGESK